MLIKELVETAPLMTMEENKYKKINLAKDLLGEKDILKHLIFIYFNLNFSFTHDEKQKAEFN